jgi:hypothetical protein
MVKPKRYNSFNADSAAFGVASIRVAFGIERSHVICLFASCRVAEIAC